MLLIQQISSRPKQKFSVQIENNELVTIEIYYSAQQYGWFIRSLEYNDFLIENLRITNSPNMLYQFKNIIPFGLACFTEGNREPTQITDFADAAAKLYIATEAEVQAYSDYLSNG